MFLNGEKWNWRIFIFRKISSVMMMGVKRWRIFLCAQGSVAPTNIQADCSDGHVPNPATPLMPTAKVTELPANESGVGEDAEAHHIKGCPWVVTTWSELKGTALGAVLSSYAPHRVKSWYRFLMVVLHPQCTYYWNCWFTHRGTRYPTETQHSETSFNQACGHDSWTPPLSPSTF